jgi:aerobic-type carbon monoxide dehydrogenase small subunit (CoxS/CutS family)
MNVKVTINGVPFERDVEPRTLLAYFIRRLRHLELRVLRRRDGRRTRGEVLLDVRGAG